MTGSSATLEPQHSTPPQGRPWRLLFVKDRLVWPRSSGHDVHTYYLMQRLVRMGHTVAMATMETSTPEAIHGLDLVAEYSFAENTLDYSDFPITLTKSQERFRGYWGVDERKIRWVAAVANHFRADAVMVVGLNVLPYLGGVKKALRVWYAADEWVWHHISQVKTLRPSTWNELKPALVKGLYERAYRSLLDRVWVVSKSDAKAFRWFAGIRNVDIMPNGVDAEFFAPGNEPVRAKSAVFWGRLDFGPNIQAIEWFCTKVWPKIRIQMPDASFSIYGFQPTPAVTRFAGRDGVTVTADLPDIRSAVRSHAVVVLPFVSGGGIKNKLLEAAGMAMPIICTSRVSHGLKGDVPFSVAHSTHSWVSQLKNLWQDEAARQSLGVRAREWVLSHHTWNAAARTAMEGLRCAKGVPT